MKKPNLAEIARAAGSARRHLLAPVEEPVLPAERPKQAPSRAGTKQIAAHFPDEVAWQLRELAVHRRTTVQHLVGEALNDLFQKHGLPEIVPVKPMRTGR
ncbi:MAG: ribbon-helix-helix domain-containing protein [Parvibaculaceae bacterium]|jgi:hypothetical protein